jgi:TRAP-type C4-dicarboxylate transport system substrate-binding protein
MSKIRKTYRFLALTVVVLLLVGFNLCQAADAPKSREMKWALFLAENAYQAPLIKKWRDSIEAYSNGAIKIKIYWVGQMAETKDLPELVRTGSTDMMSTGPNFNQSTYPLNSTLQGFAMLIKGTERSAFIGRNLREFPDIQAEFAKNNEHCLTKATLAEYVLYTKKPFRTLEDFKGTRLRTMPGKYTSDWMKSLGAVNHDVPMADIYESLMRRVLDGVVSNAQFVDSLKLYEIVKYSSYSFGNIVGWQTSVNLNVWNSFTQEIKNAFIRASHEFNVADLELNLTSEKKSIESLKQKGVQYINIDPEAQRAFIAKGGDPWMGARDSMVNTLKVDPAVADRFLKRWRELDNEYEKTYARTGKKWEYQ